MAKAARKEVSETVSKLYVAFELSEKNWKLVFSDGVRTTEAGAPARDLSRVLDWWGALADGPVHAGCSPVTRQGGTGFGSTAR